MKVTVYVPEEFTGAIMNELTGKRGKFWVWKQHQILYR